METLDNKIKINFWLVAISFAVILGSAGLGVLYMARANSIVGAKIAENKEVTRPAKISAIVIDDKNCEECFDAAQILTTLLKANVKFTSKRIVDRTEAEAKELIAKYTIEKLPTVILEGEVQKDESVAAMLARAGDLKDDTFVLKQIGGPFVEASTGEIKGKTKLTLIGDVSCGSCYDVRQHQLILRQYGLNPEIKMIDIASPEAKTVINQYKIISIPTFVLSGEVKEYPALLKVWPQVGMVKDGAYVFTLGVPSMGVYKNLKTGKIINPVEAASTQ